MPAQEQKAIRIPGVRRIEPNRLGRNVCLVFSALILAAGIGAAVKLGIGHGPDTGAFVRVMLMGILGGLAGSWYFHNVAKKVSKLAQDLRTAADGVFLGAERVVPRDEIASALIWPSKTGAIVRIERRGRFRRPLDLGLPSLEEARALTRAIGQGGAQAARSFTIGAPSRAHLRRRIYALWASLPLGVAAVVAGKTIFGPGALTGALAALALLTVLTLLGLFFKSTAVTVGADGVRVGWLWQNSFIPIGDVERAEALEGPTNAMGYYSVLIRIHRRSGPTVDLLSQLGRATPFTPRDGKWRDYALMNAAAVAERINEAALGEGRGDGGAELTAWESELLSRGARATDAWVKSLRGLHTAVESFRQRAGGGIEALWGVLEDATATPERRAAAAVALSPHLDEGGRARVRIAAQATAASKLRIALEAAADADDEALTEALEGVSTETTKLQRVGD